MTNHKYRGRHRTLDQNGNESGDLLLAEGGGNGQSLGAGRRVPH